MTEGPRERKWDPHAAWLKGEDSPTSTGAPQGHVPIPFQGPSSHASVSVVPSPTPAPFLSLTLSSSSCPPVSLRPCLSCQALLSLCLFLSGPLCCLVPGEPPFSISISSPWALSDPCLCVCVCARVCVCVKGLLAESGGAGCGAWGVRAGTGAAVPLGGGQRQAF